jgi:hypothetical protein
VCAQATIGAPRGPFAEARQIPADYSPTRHIRTTLAIGATILTFGVWLALKARPVDWLLLPVFWAIANVIEWLFHRYPMHRPLPPRLLYRNHAQLHHLAFTEQSMPITEARELGLVMMPWYTMLGLFVLVSPLMIAAGLAFGPGPAGVFLIAAVGYFLTYELLHALYHLPVETLKRSGLRGNWLFTRLQAHHTRHHALKRMAHVNFNVTFPLTDWLMGTRESNRRGDG